LTIKHLNFDVENFEVLENDTEDINESQFSTAKIQAFSSDINRHDMSCSEEVLTLTAPTIYNKPILYSIDSMFDDFASHTSPDKSLIAGFVVPDSAEFVKQDDGRTSLVVMAKIWKKYAPKFIDFFKRDSSTKKVSVEMELYESEKQENGITDMLNFAYSGICILGDLITEASPGANMQVLSFAKEREEYQEAYQAEFSMKYENIDFTIPESVKESSQKGLALYSKFGRGATSVSLSTAKFLVKNAKVTPDKARIIFKYFSRNKDMDFTESNPPNNSYIKFMLWGGSDGVKWSKELFDKIEEADNKQLAYFSETITMPYTKISEINPSLKGIDPPITLGQANAIAAQADAVGTDEKKSGWAIAISSFKKTHTVKDGKWVKKEGTKEKLDMTDKKKIEEPEEEEMAEENKPLEEEMAAKETPEEEKKEQEKEGEDKEESPEEETEEEKKEKEEKMSLSANLDLAAMLAMLGGETGDYAEIAQEFSKSPEEADFAKIAMALYDKMCKMAAELDKEKEEKGAYMSKNESLEKFKADSEQKEFDTQVGMTMKEIECDVPTEEMDAMREDSKNFSLADIDNWKNAVRAKAFEFSKNKKKPEDVGFSIANPWLIGSDKKQPKSIWKD
jgi:hypothetical protein